MSRRRTLRSCLKCFTACIRPQIEDDPQNRLSPGSEASSARAVSDSQVDKATCPKRTPVKARIVAGSRKAQKKVRKKSAKKKAQSSDQASTDDPDKAHDEAQPPLVCTKQAPSEAQPPAAGTRSARSKTQQTSVDSSQAPSEAQCSDGDSRQAHSEAQQSPDVSSQDSSEITSPASSEGTTSKASSEGTTSQASSEGTTSQASSEGTTSQVSTESQESSQSSYAFTDVAAHITAQYDIVSKLGQGSFGEVFKAVEKATGAEVAIKKIFPAFHTASRARSTYREVFFLKTCQHPNIIALRDVHWGRVELYLVVELMAASLHEVIQQNSLSDDNKRSITYQIASALDYLHEGEVVHRDLKPANILVSPVCRCKVGDLGMAASFPDSRRRVFSASLGTRCYQAPEVLLGSQSYSVAADMWSFGCIVFEILRGCRPFSGNEHMVLQAIFETLPCPSAEDIANLRCNSAEIAALEMAYRAQHTESVTEMLADSPADSIDLVNQLLRFNEDMRATAKETLRHKSLAKFHCTKEPSTRQIQQPLHLPESTPIQAYIDAIADLCPSIADDLVPQVNWDVGNFRSEPMCMSTPHLSYDADCSSDWDDESEPAFADQLLDQLLLQQLLQRLQSNRTF